MNKLAFFFVIAITLSISISMIHESSAQSVIPPRHQWKQIDTIDDITCKDGLILLQKNNGVPACVSPTAYLKLVDRGYGMYDSSLMMKHPEMATNLMKNMASNDHLMTHWHEMMQKDPVMMKTTMNDWVSLMKNNTNYLKNMMSPMTSDPELRQQMIEHMKSHPQMESALKQNTRWMDSVHQPMTDSDMGHGMGSGMNQGMDKGAHQDMCQWCPDYERHMMPQHPIKFANSDRMMDMMHHMWIDNDMIQDMHRFMLENPSHMAQMQHQMMEPMLRNMIDDPELRQQMIEMMLDHQEFMNSIRHENATR